MKTIFELCQPRPDVLQDGSPHEDRFAAQLYQVIQDDPPTTYQVYRDPEQFFENTYPTAGLRAVLTEALGRLTGTKPNASPILRLETSFGGGKTHNLIALYHAARGALPRDLALRFVPTLSYLPEPGEVQVAVLVGNVLDPLRGVPHEQGVAPRTPWGELAYQLAGIEGYAQVQAHDIQGTAPSIPVLERVIGTKPTLILIDELAVYLRKAQRERNTTSIATQVAPFLMALFELATSRPNIVVVFTLAGEKDAFAKETADLLQELRRISARQEHVLTPAAEDELPYIVTHRLFQYIQRDEAEPLFHAYLDAYRRWESQNISLPARATRAEYLDELYRAYPFHPELLYILTHKVSTIPNFQRTRGALRLLARVVQRLWQNPRDNIYLIHPHHIDFTDPHIVGDLTSRLERPKFQQVIEADIISQVRPAHAQVGDEHFLRAGKPPYTQRVAQTVFLHSLVQGMTSGARLDELNLGVLEPSDDPMLVKQALEYLEDHAWFFEFDGHRYRFKTEPSLNKIIMDEMASIGRTHAKEFLDKEIKRLWRSGLIHVVHFPREPREVKDQAEQPQLIVMHYDAAHVQAARASMPPDLVRRIFKYAGVSEAPRQFANYLAFLVADQDRIEAMVEKARRFLAIERLLRDTDRLREFSEEQQKRLKKLRDAARLEMTIAITRCYRHLYYPQADAPPEADRLAHLVLPAHDQGRVPNDHVEPILQVLRETKKALVGEDKPLAARYVKSRAWPHNHEVMSTADLQRAFARVLSLPWLLDPNQLRRTIRNGIERGLWVYYDARTGQAYDSTSPPAPVEISDDTYLYLPEAAQSKGLLQTPPSTSSQQDDRGHDNITEQDKGINLSPSPLLPPRELTTREDLPVRQAFIRLRDLAEEADVEELQALRVQLVRSDPTSVATALRGITALLPILPGQKRLLLEYSAAWEDDSDLSLQAQLPDKRYRQLAQILQSLAQQASDIDLELTLELTFSPPQPLADMLALIEPIETLGLGRIRLAAEPAHLQNAS